MSSECDHNTWNGNLTNPAAPSPHPHPRRSNVETGPVNNLTVVSNCLMEVKPTSPALNQKLGMQRRATGSWDRLRSQDPCDKWLTVLWVQRESSRGKLKTPPQWSHGQESEHLHSSRGLDPQCVSRLWDLGGPVERPLRCRSRRSPEAPAGERMKVATPHGWVVTIRKMSLLSFKTFAAMKKNSVPRLKLQRAGCLPLWEADSKLKLVLIYHSETLGPLRIILNLLSLRSLNGTTEPWRRYFYSMDYLVFKPTLKNNGWEGKTKKIPFRILFSLAMHLFIQEVYNKINVFMPATITPIPQPKDRRAIFTGKSLF